MVDLPADDPVLVDSLVQYLYEADYGPALQSDAETSTKKAKETNFPHSCLDKHGWNRCAEGYWHQFCPHHHCGVDCVFNCENFCCYKCLSEVIDSAENLLTHVKMYEIADKYDVTGLKDVSKEKFDRACKYFWAEPAFLEAATHAFSTTPNQDRGLRNIVSNTISQHMELMEKAEIQTLMSEGNGLAMGLLMQKAKENGWVKK